MITSVVALLEETPEAEGRVVGAFANDVPCWIAPIPDRDGRLLPRPRRVVATRRATTAGQATVKQIIVCDPTGRFPWEQGCRASYRTGQSLLLPQIIVREPRTIVTDQQGGASATG